MKIDVLSSDQDLHITLEGKITKNEEIWFRSMLDHAWLKKRDVTYEQNDSTLLIKLTRHEQTSKARRKFFGLVIWNNAIPPTKQSLLIIRDVEHYDIRDEDPKIPQKQEVILGGVAFNNDEIYIGAFCEHENAYGITIKVKRLDISLEDIASL